MSDDSKKCGCNCHEIIQKKLVAFISGMIEGAIGKINYRLEYIEEKNDFNFRQIGELKTEINDSIKNISNFAKSIEEKININNGSN